VFVIEALDLGLETGDGQMGSMTVDDLCDDEPKQDYERQ
jgi:hypothetical protein